MPLPINFLPDVKSKLDDAALIEKLKNEKKKSKLSSNNMLDVLERIRQDITDNLSYKMDMFEAVVRPSRLEEYIEKANKYGYIAIDTETTGLNPLAVDIVGFSMYFPGEKAIYVPINHEDYLTGNRLIDQMTEEQLKPILEKLTAKIIMHNAQFDIRIFKHTIGVVFKCWWDTQEAAFLLDEESSHRLKDLHSTLISHVKEQMFNEYYKNIKYQLVPIELAYPYAANDALDTFEVFEYQYKTQGLNEQSDMWWLYRNIEIPMIDVIVELEDNGVYVDMNKINDFKVEYHTKLDTALDECYAEIANIQGQIDTYMLAHPECKLKQPINIGSATQLAILFYDILGVKPIKDMKARAMDEKALDVLKEKYPLASKIVDYRKAQKITSTYIDNIYEIVHTDGRVHTGFRSNGAVTGRMSSREPLNLQNIPARGPGKKLRQMYAGQTIIRDVEIRSDNAYILDRCEEVELKDGSWVWSEILKAGDVLANGETVKDVIVKPFKVLIGIETDGPVIRNGILQGRTVYVIQGSDYSAQEPRLLSQLCADEGMLQAYREGKDLYCEIAAISFHRPYKKCLEHFPKGAPIKQDNEGHWVYALLKDGTEDDINDFADLHKYLDDDFNPECYDYDKLADGENDTFAEGKEFRGQAKKILLGIMYGRGEKSIGEQLGCTPEEAHDIKESVYTSFPKIKPFEEASNQMVRVKGYVTTLWGRRRRLVDYNLPTLEMYYVYEDNEGNEIRREDLSKVNPVRAGQIKAEYANVKWNDRDEWAKKLKAKEGIVVINNSSKIARAGRQIINSRVQGSAADMSKLALIKIYSDEELKKRKVKLIIPVHDEILVETPLRYAKYVRERFANDMMTAARPVLTIPVKCDVETSDRWYGEQMDLDTVLAGLPEC